MTSEKLMMRMTEGMMLDLRYDGIRAAIVMPGSVNTDFSHVGQDRQNCVPVVIADGHVDPA